MQRQTATTRINPFIWFMCKRAHTQENHSARSLAFMYTGIVCVYIYIFFGWRSAFASFRRLFSVEKHLRRETTIAQQCSASSTNRFVSLLPFIAFLFRAVILIQLVGRSRDAIHSMWSNTNVNAIHIGFLSFALFLLYPKPAVPCRAAAAAVFVCVDADASLIFAECDDGKMVMHRATRPNDGKKETARTHFTQNVENTSWIRESVFRARRRERKRITHTHGEERTATEWEQWGKRRNNIRVNDVFERRRHSQSALGSCTCWIVLVCYSQTERKKKNKGEEITSAKAKRKQRVFRIFFSLLYCSSTTTRRTQNRFERFSVLLLWSIYCHRSSEYHHFREEILTVTVSYLVSGVRKIISRVFI